VWWNLAPARMSQSGFGAFFGSKFRGTIHDCATHLRHMTRVVTLIPIISLGFRAAPVKSRNIRPARTHCRHGHPLTPDNVYKDKRWNGTYACRQCKIRAAVARKQKLRGTYERLERT